MHVIILSQTFKIRWTEIYFQVSTLFSHLSGYGIHTFSSHLYPITLRMSHVFISNTTYFDFFSFLKLLSSKAEGISSSLYGQNPFFLFM